jgi:hypothetical protein
MSLDNYFANMREYKTHDMHIGITHRSVGKLNSAELQFEPGLDRYADIYRVVIRHKDGCATLQHYMDGHKNIRRELEKYEYERKKIAEAILTLPQPIAEEICEYYFGRIPRRIEHIMLLFTPCRNKEKKYIDYYIRPVRVTRNLKNGVYTVRAPEDYP